VTDNLDSILDLRRRLYRMLDGTAGAMNRAATTAPFTPPLDVLRTPEGFSITVELPGLSREDIEVELQGNLLTISGERKADADAGQQWLRRERPSGRFSRSLALPTRNHEELAATFKDGVLTVKVRGEGA
jgi:HSP20 family protein